VTSLTVEVSDPIGAEGLELVTELTAVSGKIADPFALETTYACAFDVSGEVEVCVNVKLVDPNAEPDAGTPEGGMPEGGVSEAGVSSAPEVGAATAALRKPHVRLRDPLECSETQCTTIICPDIKNQCPVIENLTIEPTELEEGETATIQVVAEDTDANPLSLITTLTASRGTITDPNASETTYNCDPDVGGAVEICVVASDGDSSCNVERCKAILCPGELETNTCPVIESFTATPMTIAPGETMADIVVDVSDLDGFPMPLRTELRSDTGVFGDRFVTETTFTCGDSGPVELCVDVFDGDPDCDKSRCITVQCPSDIPANLCPDLFVLNALDSTIPPGQTSTMVQSRARDLDGLPLPLELTMRALWGTIEDDENIQLPTSVVGQNATYICDRPGETEICVDATDGACEKTLCIEVDCPNDIPPP
jgi:hypothetical protein